MKDQIKIITDSKILRGWLDSVPRGEYNKHKAALVYVCGVKAHTLSNWLYGNCRIPASAKRLINAYTSLVSGREIFTIAKPDEFAKVAADITIQCLITPNEI